MLVLISHPHADWIAERVRSEHPDLEIVAGQTPADVAEHLHRAGVVFLGKSSPGLAWESAANLRWVQTLSAGVDNLADTLPPGVQLTRGFSLPWQRASMSEHCLGLMLLHARGFRHTLASQERCQWDRQYPLGLLQGKVLGIAGPGELGTALAQRASAFEMEIVALRRSSRSAPHVKRVYQPGQLEEFLSGLDYLVILLPLTRETRHMFGAQQFAAMKPGAVLINMGRGSVVNEAELIAGLKQGRPAWALLDVFEEEPLPTASALWSLPNVVITPHRGGGDNATNQPQDGLDLFLDNLARFRASLKLSGLVDRDLGY